MGAGGTILYSMVVPPPSSARTGIMGDFAHDATPPHMLACTIVDAHACGLRNYGALSLGPAAHVHLFANSELVSPGRFITTFRCFSNVCLDSTLV